MAKSPAFQFYANDFMDATSTWEANAVGLYVRCLCKQWTHGAIPSDLKILARAIHCDREELERCWDVLAPKFVKLEDGTLINKRLEAVRERHEYVSSKRSEAGKAGAIAKANAKANAVVLPLSNDKQRKVKEKDVFNSGENGTREAPEIWPSFADWWKLYAKGSRKLSAEAWEKLSQADREAAMAATPPYLQSRPEVKYRKDGERFLKNRTWEDPIIQNNDTSKPHQLSEAEKLAAVLALAESRRAAAPLVDQDGHPDGWGEQP